MKKLDGISVSQGIAIGQAFLYLANETPEIKRFKISEEDLDNEIRRFDSAIEEAADELRTMMENLQKENKGSKEQTDILFAHLLMIKDIDFHDQIKNNLRQDMENIEWVLFNTSRAIMKNMLSSPDSYFMERAADINDVSDRIMNRLYSIKKSTLADLDQDVILVAKDLLPSDVLGMNRNHVKGIVTETGSTTSHTAILARAFDIPAMLGAANAASEIKTGDTLVVSGLESVETGVFINPSRDDLDRFEKLRAAFLSDTEKYADIKELPAQTLDGYSVKLKANIELVEEAEKALDFGAEGIGLFRSEFLFMKSAEAADEDHQYSIYKEVLEKMHPHPVTIRTSDLGGDKTLPDFFTDLSLADEKNPLLGWRAIRFSLSRPDFFKTQLRAILRAGVKGNVKIMFPLVSVTEELMEALKLLEEAKEECRKKNQAIAENIETGVMIEVPSAAVTADILAKYAAFFSIGTNDLMQYSLAADRGNEKLNYLADYFHPAFLRLIKNTIDAAHKQGIIAAMCGEMASDPKMTAILIGMGIDELSMAYPAIPLVKSIILKLKHSSCRELAEEILKGESSSENKTILEAWMKKNG